MARPARQIGAAGPRHPYLTNLAIGVGAAAVLAVALSLLSGGIGTVVVWFPLKLAYFVPLVTLATWFQQRSRRADDERDAAVRAYLDAPDPDDATPEPNAS